MGASVFFFLHEATCENVSLTWALSKEPVRGVDVCGDGLADPQQTRPAPPGPNLAVNVPEMLKITAIISPPAPLTAGYLSDSLLSFLLAVCEKLIYPVTRLSRCSSESFLISGWNLSGDDIHMRWVVSDFSFVSHFIIETEIGKKSLFGEVRRSSGVGGGDVNDSLLIFTRCSVGCTGFVQGPPCGVLEGSGRVQSGIWPQLFRSCYHHWPQRPAHNYI